MADLIYTVNVSLDGFSEDADGTLNFTSPSDEVFDFITDLERSASTYVYGRRQYEAMAVWETDPSLAAQSARFARFAKMWQAADKVVYSTTLDAPFTAKTRVARTFDAGAVTPLKADVAGHVTIGGANLAAQALRAGIVDECRLFVAPVVTGGGKPALPRDVRVGLELVDTHRFTSGTVYLRYRVTR